MPGENDNAGGGNAGGAAGDAGAAAGAGAAEKIAAGAAGAGDAGAGASGGAAGDAGAAGGEAGKAAGAAGADGKQELPAGWTEQNWREKYAGEDAAKLNVLKRYPSLKEALDASFTARSDLQKLLSNQAPGKDASPEQVKAWRTAQGVPETPEKYLDALPKELAFSEADKPGVMGYLKQAHERGDKPEVVAATLKVYNDAVATQIADIQRKDSEAKVNLESTLKKEWGGEFDANFNIFNNYLSTAPEEIRETIKHMRMGDGTAAMLSVPFVKWMTQNARAANPMGINTGGDDMGTMASVETQIGEYEKMMRTDSRAWYKDETKQAHYRQLLTYREKNTQKTGRKAG